MDRNALIAIIAATVVGVGLNACTRRMNAEALPPPADAVTTTLMDASGAAKGAATVRAMGDGIHVDATVVDMPPGVYAIHLHQVGACTPPDFAAAGPHWNPTARQHGSDNPQGAHKGDLPNIEVGPDGRGSISAHIGGVALRGTGGALLDADGAAIVVHANADDYRTDPSGNAGGRIACGELRPS